MKHTKRPVQKAGPQLGLGPHSTVSLKLTLLFVLSAMCSWYTVQKFILVCSGGPAGFLC